MMTGMVHDQNLEKQIEKQMGCMSGFLQLFDRHQMMTGKRLYATKRLPPTVATDSTSESEKSVGSPAISRELEKPQQTRAMTAPSPDRLKPSPVMELRSPVKEIQTPAEIPAKSPLPLPVFELKEGTRSSWKFCKEAPRLSLDSRATVDAKGGLYPREIRTNAAILSANRCDNSGDASGGDGDDKHRRSPSVIARLMGLEPLPQHSDPEPVKKAELRRSASESRVSRDLFQSRFIDGNNYQLKQTNHSHSLSKLPNNATTMENNATKSNVRLVDPMEYSSKNAKSVSAKASHRGAVGSPWKSHQQRKSFFDSEDFFPEPKQPVSIYGEIERRLKMRGIDEPSKDLDTLKQILEALQLKGLLHSKKPMPTEQISRRNFVYDPRNFSSDESSIVVIRPSRSPINRRFGNESPPSSYRCRAGVRRNVNLAGESLSPQRNRPDIDRSLQNQPTPRNSCSPTRSESNAKGPNSPLRRKPLNVETQRKPNESVEQQRRVSQLHSPKLSPRRSVSNQTNTSQSPRHKKPTAEIHHPKEKLAIVTEDESSSVSESSADTERSKMEEYKEGRSLLERCDKLLHSIAEMTATELQPSPVSVLDSSFYKDESSSSPSPVMKRSIDFKDQAGEWEEEVWSPAISPVGSKSDEKSDDCDFVYISEILRASNYLPEDADVFLLVEKQQCLKGKDTSPVSRLQRRLIFDTINEIVERNSQLPPWKALSWANSGTRKPSLNQIWSEFQRIRERDSAEELFEIICGVLRKDLAGDGVNGWGDCPVEMSEAVLDIERLIFKDLVGETIRDLAAFAGKSMVAVPRRKLVF
ncbi:protein LONGIFOLIA 1 [Cornus florida]|uniref:protein LONGIFOLIA 1 n=1 Tax=Cornus florida TaxID=4283 RepID=UPI0028988DE8|nr:protein LONGIFOLIA 1 [Cornus florida]